MNPELKAALINGLLKSFMVLKELNVRRDYTGAELVGLFCTEMRRQPGVYGIADVNPHLLHDHLYPLP